VSNAFEKPLRDHGIRLTRQRELLFEVIHNSSLHLNAEQIYSIAKKKVPKINRVTVYRTLKLLKHEGLVDELDLMHFSGEQHYYETRLKQEHAHLVCMRCGEIREYFGESLQHMKEEIAAQFGFEVVLARTEVGGICPNCQKQDWEKDEALHNQWKAASRQFAAPASLDESLRQHGIRLTRQRRLLFEIIHNAREHLDAEQIYSLVKKRGSKVNRVTVYRTLKRLKHEGLIDELDLMHFAGEQHFYETRLKKEHAHLVCLRCGLVQEYFGEPIQTMKQQIGSQFGVNVLVIRPEIGGFCANCQKMDLGENRALKSELEAVTKAHQSTEARVSAS
jgi:Fur family ferric uptake transcriptional regulator